MNNIDRALEPLKTVDIYSIVLFTIFQLKGDPKYSTLSELCYILDNHSFINLVEYYGGKTISIPTMKEFKDIVDAICLYDLVNLEGQELNKAIKNLKVPEEEVKDLKSNYLNICKILENYEFKRS